MSAIGYDTSAAPRRVGAKPQRWRRFARALRRFDDSQPYSLVRCVAILLVFGLIVKLTPVIQAYLHH